MPPNDGHDATLTDERLKEQKRVADFLSAPRKKRRSYVVTALTQSTAADYRTSIEHFLRVNFKNMAVAHCHNVEELKKAFGRQVVMVIYDDEFADRTLGMQLIHGLKTKKTAIASSALFLTRNPSALIEEYNKVLLPFHESDDYCVVDRTEVPVLFSKIRNGLANQNRRRARRYKVDIPIQYYALNDDKDFVARLTDLSIHGAMIDTGNSRLFVADEQIKISIQSENYMGSSEGDYLKLSARVRRVQIGGHKAGLSFEHVSQKQLLRLTMYLSSMVSDQVAKAALTQKLRSVK